MHRRLTAVVVAATLAVTLAAEDQVAVADFGAGKTGLFKVTRLLSDFTKDKAKAKLAMALVKASGGTPMFESVSELLIAFNLKFPAASYPNRALVILSKKERYSGKAL